MLEIGIGDGFAYFSRNNLYTFEPGGNLWQMLYKSGGGDELDKSYELVGFWNDNLEVNSGFWQFVVRMLYNVGF